jgi:hypothetical protein
MDHGDVFLVNGVVREEPEHDVALIAGQDYLYKVNEKTCTIKSVRKIAYE